MVILLQTHPMGISEPEQKYSNWNQSPSTVLERFDWYGLKTERSATAVIVTIIATRRAGG